LTSDASSGSLLIVTPSRLCPGRAWLPLTLLATAAGLLATLPTAPVRGQPAPADSTNGALSADGGLVVHFGDSFVHAGLQQTLRPKFRAMNTRYVSQGKTSSWLATWARGPDLENLYWSYHPSLFIVTLGANDLCFHPADKQAHLVHEIVRKMRGTPCVWVGIPIWETAPRDQVEMTRRECGPCRYFDSNALATQISRQADGRHPDAAGGALWAQAFWSWLLEQRDLSRGGWSLKPAPPDEHAPRPDPDPWGRKATQAAAARGCPF
jgi:hypothetical protein